jgi:hypothetical protein
MFRPGTIGGSTVNASGILAAVRTFLNANITNLYTGMVYRAQTNVDVLDGATGAVTNSWTGADPGNVTGTGTGDPLSPALAWIIRWNSATVLNRRFVKGRTFLGIPSEGRSDSPGGIPSAAGAAVLQTASSNLITGFADGTQLVVWHRPTLAAPSSGLDAPVIAASVRTDGWGTQRRRRVGF